MAWELSMGSTVSSLWVDFFVNSKDGCVESSTWVDFGVANIESWGCVCDESGITVVWDWDWDGGGVIVGATGSFRFVTFFFKFFKNLAGFFTILLMVME